MQQNAEQQQNNVIEIDLMRLLQTVLQTAKRVWLLILLMVAVFAAGAFPAEAGEFTRRAFMNGKMDLAQAEAVMQLISAQGREAMKAAQAGHDGALSRRIGVIRDDLTDIGAHLSAWADYPDDDIPQVDENML